MNNIQDGDVTMIFIRVLTNSKMELVSEFNIRIKEAESNIFTWTGLKSKGSNTSVGLSVKRPKKGKRTKCFPMGWLRG